ncbi:MAG: alpha/beta hydrolase, partial [Hyphomicrobiales bacterium]
MFDRFETRLVPGAGADICVHVRGTGEPLLLLHG